MRGGSQSQLMLCADGQLWVVKFRNNPQGLRILANEMMVTRLAKVIGLSVPQTRIINVPESLIAQDPRMEMEFARGMRETCLSGEHFGSALVGGSMPGLVVDYLSDSLLREVRNVAEFAGMLAIDKWTGNCDGRQAVFQRTARERKYRAVFIDQGFCFNAEDWNFPDSPMRGVFGRNTVYEGVTGWESFEPWLSRIETMTQATLWRIAETVPAQWYGGDPKAIQSLMNKLHLRRSRVRELISSFRDSDRDPFPSWGAIR